LINSSVATLQLIFQICDFLPPSKYGGDWQLLLDDSDAQSYLPRFF
jgi:hypothetical protein